MDRKTLLTLLTAIVLAAAIGGLTLAFAGSNTSGGHRMPDGSMMDTPAMPIDGTHTMGDGSTMNGDGQP